MGKILGLILAGALTFGDQRGLRRRQRADRRLCRMQRHWTSMLGQMVTRYGAPDGSKTATLPNQTPSASAEFKFSDGSHIDATSLAA